MSCGAEGEDAGTWRDGTSKDGAERSGPVWRVNTHGRSETWIDERYADPGRPKVIRTGGSDRGYRELKRVAVVRLDGAKGKEA